MVPPEANVTFPAVTALSAFTPNVCAPVKVMPPEPLMKSTLLVHVRAATLIAPVILEAPNIILPVVIVLSMPLEISSPPLPPRTLIALVVVRGFNVTVPAADVLVVMLVNDKLSAVNVMVLALRTSPMALVPVTAKISVLPVDAPVRLIAPPPSDAMTLVVLI